MDAEIKQKWVTALRSGEFKQAKGRLAMTDGSYCCLGVLCLVSGMERIRLDHSSYFGFGEKFECFLPDDLAQSADVTHEDQETLTKMNDGTETSRRHSFAEIADYIEREL